MWQCSVALLRDSGLKPISSWSFDDFKEAYKMALATLHGVGVFELRHEEKGQVAIHIRRPMTDDEAAPINSIRARRTMQ